MKDERYFWITHMCFLWYLFQLLWCHMARSNHLQLLLWWQNTEQLPHIVRLSGSCGLNLAPSRLFHSLRAQTQITFFCHKGCVLGLSDVSVPWKTVIWSLNALQFTQNALMIRLPQIISKSANHKRGADGQLQVMSRTSFTVPYCHQVKAVKQSSPFSRSKQHWSEAPSNGR